MFADERDGFARQLAFLARESEPVTLGEAVERLRDGRVEGREFAVTFGDGFRNQLQNAVPILAEHGIRACFYLISELVSAAPDRVRWICRERLHLPRPIEPLSWEEAAELVALGHEVGSHTRTHPNLAEADAAELDEELRGSREELERRLGRPAPHFSAPYGAKTRFTPAISEAARAAGYASCATSWRGPNTSTDVYALRRDHLVAGWPVADLRTFLFCA